MKEKTRRLFDDIAVELQHNVEKEADAIKNYQELINRLRWREKSDDKEEVECAEMLIEQLEEFVSDELNHQEGLHDLYITLSGIKEAKD